MALYKSKNPALSINTFKNIPRVADSVETMTIQGTVNKIAFLGLIVFASALYVWNKFTSIEDIAIIQPYIIGGFIAAFIAALVIIFKKTTAPYMAPLYCVFEGLALGGLSGYMESVYPGIVFQAILLTFGILFSLLLIYKMKIIAATENFKLIVASATAGIAICYLVSFIGGFFGFNLPFIHGNSTFGIVFSLFVVVIAALNLVMDFDFIEKGAESNAPKYMEWYAAFGLMVTLIWLYIEILRLLSKLRSR
jgi:uncharacterized YccA/Bax inhibitor family protein